jgi:Kef-type K+ transport system membrane component KefB
MRWRQGAYRSTPSAFLTHVSTNLGPGKPIPLLMVWNFFRPGVGMWRLGTGLYSRRKSLGADSCIVLHFLFIFIFTTLQLEQRPIKQSNGTRLCVTFLLLSLLALNFTLDKNLHPMKQDKNLWFFAVLSDIGFRRLFRLFKTSTAKLATF